MTGAWQDGSAAKVLAGKHEDPNLMLATHMAVRENQVSKVILRPSRSRRDTRAHTYKQVQYQM